ncbi:MAG: hypothetical protein LC803_03590 [Acidobacteria bacterium]|nr:hypothetical protein [Acidobacteriota bacterium]
MLGIEQEGALRFVAGLEGLSQHSLERHHRRANKNAATPELKEWRRSFVSATRF